MREEIYDYNIKYFDGDYQHMVLQFVVDSKTDKTHGETTFTYIQELDENNNAIFGSITLPYAEVTSIRVLLFDLIDGKVLKRDTSIQQMKHSIYSKNKYNNHIRKFGRRC
ncbi:MAG: hypothetical protein ACRCXT_17385 [Paraclostridium sp.]